MTTRLKLVLLLSVLSLAVAFGLYIYRQSRADLLTESVSNASTILRISVATDRGVDQATNLETLKVFEKPTPVGAAVPFFQSTPSSSSSPPPSEWIVFYEIMPFQASGRERIQVYSRMKDGTFTLSNSIISRTVTLEELREKVRELGGAGPLAP